MGDNVTRSTDASEGNDAKKSVSISVITATYNAGESLPILIESLRNQTDNDFEWIVADGGSTDNTLSLLEEIDDIRLTLTSQKDFGIYDALNRALDISSGDYYVVMGSDDYLYKDAIKLFRSHLTNDVDILSANISFNGEVIKPGRGKSWLFGPFEFVAGHAVGTLFRTSLHEKHGLYSNKFPIAADRLFIQKCCKGGAKYKFADFEAGSFGSTGLSSTDSLGVLSESFRIQLVTEKYKLLQFFIFLIRLVKNYKKF